MADTIARPQTPTATTRLRTPDAPLHGAKYDENGPVSPRRSRRSTRNPYHSTNGLRKMAAVTPPPQSSPPSPPMSPVTVRAKRTPEQRHHKNVDKLRPPQWDPRELMTPAKTPKTMTPPSTGVSRKLNFQADPIYAMPTPRKLKKLVRTEVYEEFERGANPEEVEVYSDWNVRVPTRDESDDNPFNGLPTPSTSIKRRFRRSPAKPLGMNMSNEEMAERVENDEGMIFTFRRKKIFKPFTDTLEDVDAARALGYEPMPRGKDMPRRLSFGRRPAALDEVDEEAITDIEGDMHETTTPSGSQAQKESTSPFDKWPRTKAGSRKREPDSMDVAGTSKRVRSDL